MPRSSLVICTFKWGTRYTTEHVARLHRMLARNLTIDWEFALITDTPDSDRAKLGPEIRVIPLWSEMRDTKYCGVRLMAFSPMMSHIIGPRFAWIDLDVVVTGNVDHIFSRTEDFIALSTPRPPLPYNGSLIMMDAGARAQVLTKWSPEEYARLRQYWAAHGVMAGAESDEGWMGRLLGDKEVRFTRDDGIRYFRHDQMAQYTKLPPEVRLVIMNGRAFDPSMPRWQDRCPWIRKSWI